MSVAAGAYSDFVRLHIELESDARNEVKPILNLPGDNNPAQAINGDSHGKMVICLLSGVNSWNCRRSVADPSLR